VHFQCIFSAFLPHSRSSLGFPVPGEGGENALCKENAPCILSAFRAVFITLLSLLPVMRGRRDREEEEELKQRIRALLEEGKTYEEIEGETGASRHTIAKVKKQIQREEVERHRSPLDGGEARPPTQEDQGEEEVDQDDEEAATLEAVDRAAKNTALNEVIAKVKAKAKLEVDEIYQLGLVLRDVLQGELGEEYYKEAEKSGLSLDQWIRQTLKKALWHRYYFIYSLWEHPDLYKVINWSLDAWKLWYQEWNYQLLKQQYEKRDPPEPED